MTLKKFTLRGGEDWLLFAHRNDAPDDDRAYVAVTECWPIWLTIERCFGVGTPRSSLSNPEVLAILAAEADDRDFGFPSWSVCDACNEPFRFIEPTGIKTRCGCATIDEDAVA